MSTLKEELLILAVANYLDHRINMAEDQDVARVNFTIEDLKSLEGLLRSAWASLSFKPK